MNILIVLTIVYRAMCIDVFCVISGWTQFHWWHRSGMFYGDLRNKGSSNSVTYVLSASTVVLAGQVSWFCLTCSENATNRPHATHVFTHTILRPNMVATLRNTPILWCTCKWKRPYTGMLHCANSLTPHSPAYRTEEGQPWVLPVVRTVEAQMATDPTLNHEYLPLEGMKAFTEASTTLLLGEGSRAITQNRVTELCVSDIPT